MDVAEGYDGRRAAGGIGGDVAAAVGEVVDCEEAWCAGGSGSGESGGGGAGCAFAEAERERVVGGVVASGVPGAGGVCQESDGGVVVLG